MTTDSNDEVRALLAACRKLMRSTLAFSRGAPTSEHRLDRVHQAQDCVRAALLTLDAEPAEAHEADALGRIATSLASRLVQDLLREEQQEAEEAAAPAAPQPGSDAPSDRDGFRGHTWSIPLPDLLGFLHMQQKSGVLKVKLGRETISLTLDRGDLVHAASDEAPAGTRLGEILVAQRAIDRDQLEEFLSSPPRGARLGEALVRDELITRAELRRALNRQFHLVFRRLFAAKSAYFAFREGHAENAVDVRRNISQLLLETLREAGSRPTDASEPKGDPPSASTDTAPHEPELEADPFTEEAAEPEPPASAPAADTPAERLPIDDFWAGADVPQALAYDGDSGERYVPDPATAELDEDDDDDVDDLGDEDPEADDGAAEDPAAGEADPDRPAS